MSKTGISVIFFLVLFFAPWHNTQAVSNDLLGNVVIEINPIYPKPEQRALASVNTYSLDLDKTEITWLVNGSVVKQGIGEKSTGFTMGKAGTPIRIEVRVSSKSLGVLSDSITITPASVDLLWESNTYTPNLYKAKPLHSSESQITLLAIPHISISGNKVSAKDLTYNWKINGNPQIAQSGYGKYSLTYKGPKIFGEDTIEVVASTQNSNIYASNQVKIATMDPEIIFYEENDLFGTNYLAMIPKNFSMSREEFKLRAEPFYFSEPDLSKTVVSYEWSLNGKEIQLNADPRILTLRNAGGFGSSAIRLVMKNTTKSLQEAASSFNVYFGNSL